MNNIYEFTHPEKKYREVSCISSTRELSRLAKSSDYMVRMAVACSPYTSPTARKRLSQDLYKIVRIAVAKSIFTKNNLLEKLLEDPDQEVAFWASLTLDEKEEGLDPEPA